MNTFSTWIAAISLWGGWVVQRRHMRWVTGQWERAGEKWHWIPAHWAPNP